MHYYYRLIITPEDCILACICIGVKLFFHIFIVLLVTHHNNASSVRLSVMRYSFLNDALGPLTRAMYQFC